MSRTFQCCRCKGVFTSMWDDEQMMAEFKSNFPNDNDPATDKPLCDECFEEFWAWAAINAPELKRHTN